MVTVAHLVGRVIITTTTVGVITTITVVAATVMTLVAGVMGDIRRATVLSS